MITPRRTRLVRAPDLHAFRRVLAALSCEGPASLVESTAVIVPSQGAAAELEATLARLCPPSDLLTPRPAILTREQLYDALGRRLARPPRLLSQLEREVLFRAAADVASAAGRQPPFQLRPGLVAEMVRFYDQLRRQGQGVARFERLLSDTLSGDRDRGAERLLRQTRFLAAAFLEYERRLAAAGLFDEHALRARLIDGPADAPLARAVVAVSDWIGDSHGLFAEDYDLLARVPGLVELDIVATERCLRAGFHERVHHWLPDIEEIETASLGCPTSPIPQLLVPDAEPGRVAFIRRDREEELIAVARAIKEDRSAPERTAAVFARPLPYLYLAPETFSAAGIPFQTSEGLPLAVEPAAAALDLVLDFVSSQFTRSAIVALLRCPQFHVTEGVDSIGLQSIAALDRQLSDARYLGELHALGELAPTIGSEARPAFRVAVALAEDLAPLLVPAPASAQLARLSAFLLRHADSVNGTMREAAGRDAIVALLNELEDAYSAHDDRHVAVDELASDVRRWVEDQTFGQRLGGGLHLVDRQAARFGEFDDVTILGLVEGDWPERPRRNIFYPPALLASLGWPSEQDRRGAETAAFLDLLRSSSRRLTLSTFTLDDEALVEPSALLEELTDAEWPPENRRSTRTTDVGAAATDAEARTPDARATDADARMTDARMTDARAIDAEARATDADEEAGTAGAPSAAWVALRTARTDAADARYHGEVGPQPRRALSVSAIETYLACPFKFFAERVLRLEEERDDEEVMDPKRQGQFIHQVFEAFFSRWQGAGHGAIGPSDLDAARGMFADVVESHLTRLSGPEAALERTRLLGSAVAGGLGEAVFRIEAERPIAVVERLLEHRLEGDFVFMGPNGRRTIALKGVADRLDLLEDGTFRLIDYKLSSAPARSRALQLPIYGLCAEQRLEGHRGRRWRLAEAAYVSFRGPRRVTPLFGPRAQREQVLAAAQEKLIEAVDRIEGGRFPPTPDDVFLCGFCSYAAVCRKDYVGDIA